MSATRVERTDARSLSFMICFWCDRPQLSAATAFHGLVPLDSIAVLTLTNAAPNEAAEGFLEGIMFLGSGVGAGSVAAGEAGGFRGTASSKADGLGAGDVTLPLAAAVLVFFSAFASFLDVSPLFLFIAGRLRLLI